MSKVYIVTIELEEESDEFWKEIEQNGTEILKQSIDGAMEYLNFLP